MGVKWTCRFNSHHILHESDNSCQDKDDNFYLNVCLCVCWWRFHCWPTLEHRWPSIPTMCLWPLAGALWWSVWTVVEGGRNCQRREKTQGSEGGRAAPRQLLRQAVNLSSPGQPCHISAGLLTWRLSLAVLGAFISSRNGYHDAFGCRRIFILVASPGPCRAKTFFDFRLAGNLGYTSLCRLRKVCRRWRWCCFIRKQQSCVSILECCIMYFAVHWWSMMMKY